MSNAPNPGDEKTEDPLAGPGSSGRASTPVPPRGGKKRNGPSGSNRPAAGRPGTSGANRNHRGRQARQAAQRRNRMYALVAIAAAVVIIAVVFVFLGQSSGGGGQPRQPAPAAAVTQMENVPLATMVAAVAKVNKANLNYATAAAGGPLTAGGKPKVLYIGAEFCPICGAERWPMTMALMKFGTFTNLKQTHSAVADGDVGTWSYYGSTYTSKYITFEPYELYTNQPSGSYYKPLDKLPSSAQAVWTANEGQNLAFPFIDFGGKAALETAQYNPQLVYYHNFNYVLGAVGSNNNSVGASIDAAAAVFTKYLCGLTHNQPGNVCSAVAQVSAPITSSSSGATSPAG